MPSDPRALLRSRSYLQLLLIAAVLGVPVSAAAYGFLALVNYLQPEIFTHLPHGLGFQAEPAWWPLPVLAVGGVLTGLAIRYLPGTGGALPAEGFKTHRAPTPAELPGVILAALATLIFGAVLGPEAPPAVTYPTRPRPSSPRREASPPSAHCLVRLSPARSC